MGKVSPYMQAHKKLRDSMHEAIKIADDPFKAPELFVFETKQVLEDIWNLQIEYAAMERSHGDRE